MRNFKSHFQQDFLAYCIRPVSVHLVMVRVSRSFDSFSIFLLSFKTTAKSQENYAFLYSFPVWPYLPKIMKKLFYTDKLHGLTGMK